MASRTGTLVVDRASLQFTIFQIGNASINMKRAQQAAINSGGRALLAEVERSLSYTDHTLRQLAALDHPYARRHGSIQLSLPDRGRSIRDGRHGVHRQSGRLLRGLVGRPIRNSLRGGIPQFRIEVLSAIAPHWKYIVLGTRNMLPRDPLWETAQGPGTITKIRKAIITTLGKEMRSQAHIRFGPPSGRLIPPAKRGGIV